MNDDNDNQITRVTVTDIDISLGQMIVLILKFTVACIPAAVVIATVAIGAGLVLAALGALGAVAR